MEYSQDILADMKLKKALVNPQMAKWFYAMYRESGGKIKEFDDNGRLVLQADGGVVSYFNRASRISSCCDLWLWDRYELNKVLDLQKLNRCRNSRFCPNCKKMNIQKFIHEFRAIVPDLEDYDFYMLTTTIPSFKGDGDDLKDALDKLYYTFRRLNHKFSVPLLTPSGKLSKQALQCRFFNIAGGVRVTEITHGNAGFHPHLHCVVLVKKNSIKSFLLDKRYKGKWSRKRQEYNMKSDIDLQLSKAWSMLWYGIDFRKWDDVIYDPKDTYLVVDGVRSEFKALELDFRSMDSDGVYEVFKYTFKSSDVTSYKVFKTLVDGLHGKRIRQGFGLLHNLRCDDDSDGDKQPLVLEVEEEPIQLLTKEIDELITTFADYRKISRFNPADKDGIVSNIVSRLSD